MTLFRVKMFGMSVGVVVRVWVLSDGQVNVFRKFFVSLLLAD